MCTFQADDFRDFIGKRFGRISVCDFAVDGEESRTGQRIFQANGNRWFRREEYERMSWAYFFHCLFAGSFVIGEFDIQRFQL